MAIAMHPDRRIELKKIASAFLAGEMLPIEAAMAIGCFEAEVPENFRKPMSSLSMVVSETDDIFVGERRSLWHPDVRAREDRKHDEAQAWAEPIVREACEILIAAL